MRRNFMYCFYSDKMKGIYHGIVTADSLDEAMRKLNARKGSVIHAGTLMVKQLPGDVALPSRLAGGMGAFEEDNEIQEGAIVRAFMRSLAELLADDMKDTTPVFGFQPVKVGPLVGWKNDKYYYLTPMVTVNQVRQRSAVVDRYCPTRPLITALVRHGMVEPYKGMNLKPLTVDGRTVRYLCFHRSAVEAALAGGDE